MNQILPAYETLWRVVLRCFLEVAFRSTQDQLNTWQPLLHDFHADPTVKRLHQKGEHGVSAAMIAKEALRLYPPTRRVYRHFTFSTQVFGLRFQYPPRRLAADIEGCQRSTTLWGPSADAFEPSRWISIDHTREREILLAFGTPPFLCPAQERFGIMMIALLVAALLEVVGKDWELSGNGMAEILAGGKPLLTGREDYSKLIMSRRN